MSDTTAQQKYTRQTVLAVRPWDSPGLLSLRVTKNQGFRFLPGQFARIGLPSQESADSSQATPDVWRAYSMVSHPDDDYLEFLSIEVPNGLFSPRLSKLKPGDSLWVEKLPFGFLTLERFTPSRSLWLVATGTGLSAYLPMLREPSIWQCFEKVILVHGVRTQHELAYRDDLQRLADANAQFVYLPVTSRQPWHDGQESACRITAAYQSGRLESVTGEALEPEAARIMLCGNPEMVTEMRGLLSERGFAAGRRGNPGTLAVENYW